MLEVYIDGACEPVNPGGYASYGALVFRKELYSVPTDKGWTYGEVYSERTEKVWEDKVWEDWGIVGHGPEMSNNVAEYYALHAFLRWYILHSRDEPAVVKSDSNMLVQQMLGGFQVRRGLYVPYYKEVMDLIRSHPPIVSKLEFEWIPREQNLADELSVRALKEIGIERKGK